jgi:NADH:ubiquinone oxidoreductase subunit 3 (subunit A)
VRVVATGYLFAAIFFLGGCAFVIGGLVTFNAINGLLLKRRTHAPSKFDTYESGETPLGSAWVQFPLAFYIFALLFVVFDVDIVFILSWAVIFQQLGWFSSTPGGKGLSVGYSASRSGNHRGALAACL